MPAITDSDYVFLFKSEGGDDGRPVLDFTKQSMSIWKRVVLESDIFDKTVYGEITLEDHIGVISDNLISAEGLKISTKLGNKFDGYIENDYYVSNNQLVESISTDHIAGDVTLSIFSYMLFLDSIKSKAWNDSISNIVKDIAKNVFKIPDKKLFISETTGIDKWYQINKTSFKFIEDLSEIAYSQSYKKSPFLFFTNCNNELYFMTVEELFKQKPITDPDFPYKISLDLNIQRDPMTIRDYRVIPISTSINKKNYKKKFFKQKPDGSVESEDDNFKSHMTNDEGKILIRDDLIQVFDKINTDFIDFGIYEDTDKDNYQGFVNNYFTDSSIYMRMRITIPFNPEVLCGKIIELKVGSAIKEKAGNSSEYSGKWLVIGVKHFYDMDKTPFQHLIIAKSRIKIDSSHPFKKKF